jgi:general secretion pathway protein B
MSYILEALKKTERQRQTTGRVPTPTTEHAVPNLPVRAGPGPWPVSAVGLGAVALAVALYAALATPPERGESVQTHHATATKAPEEDAQGNPKAPMAALPANALAAAPERSAARPAQPDAEEPAPPAPHIAASAYAPEPTQPAGASRSPAAAPAGGQPQPAPTNGDHAPAETPARPTRNEAPARTVPRVPSAATAPAETPTDRPVLPQGRAADAVSTQSPGSAIPAPARPAVPLLGELPYEVQTRLPELRLNVHVYAKEPADRFVLLNMRKYREGEHTAEGLLVEEIAPHDLILSHRGERLRLSRPGSP